MRHTTIDNLQGWLKVSLILSFFLTAGLAELYQKGVQAGKASFDCPKASAGAVAKIVYPNGTIKCPDYAKRVKENKK